MLLASSMTLAACDGCVGALEDAGASDENDGGANEDAGFVVVDSGLAAADAGATPSSDAGVDACGQAPGQTFPPASPWNTRIDGLGKDAESDDIIDYLQTNHTDARRFQIDFSFEVLRTTPTTTRSTFVQKDMEYYDPDCDPAPIPLPDGGALEGEDGYACTTDGDCHLLVVDAPACRLYEMWRADLTDEGLLGGCHAVWETDTTYPDTLRGEQCSSADGAGLPITALLFTPDEVVAGEIKHAIRFILPNPNIRDDVYVHPATHSSYPTAGPATSPPYGARLRLKAGVSLDALNPAARTVAIALQRYGMILSDGGNITFTARSDRSTAHTWAEAGLGPHDMKALLWSDFEVVPGGARIVWEGECSRTPVTD